MDKLNCKTQTNVRMHEEKKNPLSKFFEERTDYLSYSYKRTARLIMVTLDVMILHGIKGTNTV